MTEIGTVIPRRGITRAHTGDTLRCTAKAVVNPNRQNMNIGCQNFVLADLLRNGGTIGEYADGEATVTFVGTLREDGMLVPFHDAAQSIGNLNEYVREAVVIEPITLPALVRRVRERIYYCNTHPDEHLFVVSPTGDGAEINGYRTGQAAKVNLHTGAYGYEPMSQTMFVDNPECRPVQGPPMNGLTTGAERGTTSLSMQVTVDQLTGNARIR